MRLRFLSCLCLDIPRKKISLITMDYSWAYIGLHPSAECSVRHPIFPQALKSRVLTTSIGLSPLAVAVSVQSYSSRDDDDSDENSGPMASRSHFRFGEPRNCSRKPQIPRCTGYVSNQSLWNLITPITSSCSVADGNRNHRNTGILPGNVGSYMRHQMRVPDPKQKPLY